VDNDPEAWYQAIVQCQNHQDNLDILANAAQKKVKEQYLMANFANAYVEIFALALSTIN
jgi:hypothetical protein